MKILFICYQKCTTCQKAKKWLDLNKIEYETRDIKTDRPSENEIRTWNRKSDKTLRQMFNTSGNLYREMGLKNKLNDLTDEEILTLLASDGMLVKRPILVTDQKVFIGFKELDWKNLLD